MADRSWIVSIRRQGYPRDFEIAEGTVDEATALLESTRITTDNDRLVIILSLYNRLVTGLDSVVHLSERAFVTEGKIIFRSMLECVFRLRAICKVEEATRHYIDQDLLQRRDMTRCENASPFSTRSIVSRRATSIR